MKTQASEEGEHKDYVRTQGEDRHLQAKERDIRRNQTADTLLSNFYLPEVFVKNKC